MIRRSGMALLLVTIVACGGAQVPGATEPAASAPAATASATAGSSDGGAAADCVPNTAHADPWRLAESTADTSDQSDARIALCVAGVAPATITIEGACHWSDDRRSLRAIDGAIVGGELDGWALSIPISAASQSLFLFGPQDATYTSATPLVVRVADGISRLETTRLRSTGPAAPPLAEEIEVRVAWLCEVPPPPKAGLAGGQGSLQVDGVLGGPWTLEVDCHWSLVDGRPEVTSVDSNTDAISLQDRTLGIGLHRGNTVDGSLDFRIHVTKDVDNVDYDQPRIVTTIAVADDHSAGLLRFVQLGPQEPDPLTFDGTAATGRIDGTFRWACGPPPAAPRPWDGGDLDRADDYVEIEATLELGVPLDVRLSGTNRCLADPRPDYPFIEFVDAHFQFGDETIRIRWRAGLYLVRTVADRVIGEYESSQEWPHPDTGVALRLPTGTLTFRDTDPAWEPFAGEAGPRELTGTIELSCPAP
jgi:hypothetical protein